MRVRGGHGAGRALGADGAQHVGAAAARQSRGDLDELGAAEAMDGRGRGVEGEGVTGTGGDVERVPSDRRAGPPSVETPEAEAAKHRAGAHVHAHDPELVAGAVEVHVGDADDAPAGDVHDLRVEHVADHPELALRTGSARPRAGAEHHLRRLEARNLGPRELHGRAPARLADDQGRDGRRGLVHPHREIGHAADPGAVGVPDRLADACPQREHERSRRLCGRRERRPSGRGPSPLAGKHGRPRARAPRTENVPQSATPAVPRTDEALAARP